MFMSSRNQKIHDFLNSAHKSLLSCVVAAHDAHIKPLVSLENTHVVRMRAERCTCIRRGSGLTVRSSMSDDRRYRRIWSGLTPVTDTGLVLENARRFQRWKDVYSSLKNSSLRLQRPKDSTRRNTRSWTTLCRAAEGSDDHLCSAATRRVRCFGVLFLCCVPVAIPATFVLPFAAFTLESSGRVWASMASPEQIRAEKVLADATTIAGREEWICKFCSETNVWTRWRCRLCYSNIPAGLHKQAIFAKNKGWSSGSSSSSGGEEKKPRVQEEEIKKLRAQVELLRKQQRMEKGFGDAGRADEKRKWS